MQYQITGMEYLKRGRVAVELNGEETFLLYRGEAASLSIGEYLSQEEYDKIVHDILGKRAKKRAMHLLERQERSEAKLREKLAEGQYPQPAIEDAIEYVKRYHYVDDRRFAGTYVVFHQEQKSRYQLKMDLYRKGIAKDLIEEVLEETFDTDEKELIAHWLEKKRYEEKKDDPKERRKMYQFLLRKGFRSSDICSVMNLSDW